MIDLLYLWSQLNILLTHSFSFFFTFAAGDSKSLKILLSFAVGGLLGDVFLHLLPEAWSADLSSVKENSTLF